MGSDGGSGNAIYRNLRRPYPKQCCKIYCDKAYYGPVSGEGTEPRCAGFKVTVGAGESQYGGYTGGGGKMGLMERKVEEIDRESVYYGKGYYRG